MRFLVTGAAGFIGSHLVGHLVDTGHQVRAFDDLSTGKRENLEPWMRRIEFIHDTVLDASACATATRGVDYVLHEAALASVPRSIADPSATHEVNATGTLNVLIAAHVAGVRRVVYAASSSAYGDSAELPKHENMPSLPLSPYAVSKLAGENYMRAFTASYGLETVALRYFNVFGPRQDPESQYAAVVPKFVTSALENRPPVIYGDGQQTRDFTYVQNVVHANMLACQAPANACGRVFNVGCGDRVTLNELWRSIKKETGTRVDPIYVTARAGDVRDSLASLNAIASALGYAPQVSMREGLHRTIESFVLAQAVRRETPVAKRPTAVPSSPEPPRLAI